MSLPMIPQDKANHALLGALASVLGIGIAMELGWPPITLGYLLPIVIGFGKELVDLVSGEGEPSIGDALATAIGSWPVVLAIHMVLFP